MTRAVYPLAKQRMLDLLLALGTPKASLIDQASYTYSASHQYMTSVPGGARVATVSLSSLTTTGGVLDGPDLSGFTDLVSAPSIEGFMIWVDTGSDATSPILFYDNVSTGLPISSGATSVPVTVDAAGYFAL